MMLYGAADSGDLWQRFGQFEVYHIRGGNKGFSSMCAAVTVNGAIGSEDPSRRLIWFQVYHIRGANKNFPACPVYNAVGSREPEPEVHSISGLS